MKKLLSINIGTKAFGEKYRGATQTLGIATDIIRTLHCYFILSPDKPATLYHLDSHINTNDYAHAFIRVSGKQVRMTALVAHYLHTQSVSISDDTFDAQMRNDEKTAQMLLLHQAAVPIPHTLLFVGRAYTEIKEHLLAHIAFPCVIKGNGSQGRKVWKIEDLVAFETRVTALAQAEELVMVQEFIPNTYDIRALFLNGEILGAIKRSSADGFLNNVSQGSQAEPIILTDEEARLTKIACEAVGHTLAGADIVRTQNGPRFFEVNFGPQVYGFETATGLNVPLEILTRIKQKFF